MIATKDCKSIVKTEIKKMEETKANFIKMKGQFEDVSKLGVEIATNLCHQLLESGAPGLHFYTMNSSTATSEIYSQIKDER